MCPTHFRVLLPLVLCGACPRVPLCYTPCTPACTLWSVPYALFVSPMYLFLSALCICVYCVLLYDMFIDHFCLMCWAHPRAPMPRIFRVFIYVLYVCLYWLFVPD